MAYIIYKQGVYGHGVHGVYIGEGAKERAIGDCKLCAESDKDDYHLWSVIEVPLNTRANNSVSDGFCENEEKVLFTCDKPEAKEPSQADQKIGAGIANNLSKWDRIPHLGSHPSLGLRASPGHKPSAYRIDHCLRG